MAQKIKKQRLAMMEGDHHDTKPRYSCNGHVPLYEIHNREADLKRRADADN